jgi:hypothetical protein
MATPVQQLMDDIETLVELRLTERLAKLPLQFNTEALSYAQFEAAFMAKHDGEEPVNQGLFRTFLRWLDQFYAYHLNFDADIVRQSIKVSDIISGTYTAPDATTYTGLAPVLTELSQGWMSLTGSCLHSSNHTLACLELLTVIHSRLAHSMHTLPTRHCT